MSTTYDLACNTCKVALWVGQSRYLYTDEKHIKALEAFLYEHMGHHLVYMVDGCDAPHASFARVRVP